MIKRTICKSLLLVMVLACHAFAQTPPPVTTPLVTFPLSVGVPFPPTPGGPPSVSGTPGTAVYYYWLVTESLAGNSAPSGPFAIYNAPNTLSGSNFVFVGWNPVPGAISYDVLRTTTTSTPGGACNCAVVVGTSSTTANDQSNALNSYTVATFQPQNFQLSLDNEVVGANSTHLILRRQPGGAQLADLNVSTTGLPSTGSTGIVFQSGPSTTRVAASADIVADFIGCSGTQYLGADGACHAAGTGTVTGGGTNLIFPIWTGTSALGASNLVDNNVTSGGAGHESGAGATYTNNASEAIDLSEGGLSWNGNYATVIQNSFTPAANNNSQGITILGGSATGSACAGGVSITGGQTNGAANHSTIGVNGGCSNGFGATGSDLNLQAGSTAASNTGGNINLTPGTGGFGNGANIFHGASNVPSGATLTIQGTLTCAAGSTCPLGGLADPGSNGIVKRTALNTTTVAASSDVIGLFSTCSGTQYLGADGACHSAGTGTLTASGPPTANQVPFFTTATNLGALSVGIGGVMRSSGAAAPPVSDQGTISSLSYNQGGDRGLGIRDCWLAVINSSSAPVCDARGEISGAAVVMSTNPFPVRTDNVSGGTLLMGSMFAELPFSFNFNPTNSFKMEGTAVGNNAVTGPFTMAPSTGWTSGSGATWSPPTFAWGVNAFDAGSLNGSGNFGPYQTQIGTFEVTCRNPNGTTYSNWGVSLFSGQDGSLIHDIGISNCPVMLIAGSKATQNGTPFTGGYFTRTNAQGAVGNDPNINQAGVSGSTIAVPGKLTYWKVPSFSQANCGANGTQPCPMILAASGFSCPATANPLCSPFPGLQAVIGLDSGISNGSCSGTGCLQAPAAGTGGHISDISGSYLIGAIADMGTSVGTWSATCGSPPCSANTAPFTINVTNDFGVDNGSTCASAYSASACTGNAIAYLDSCTTDTTYNGAEITITSATGSQITGWINKSIISGHTSGTGAGCTVAVSNSTDPYTFAGTAFTAAGQFAVSTNGFGGVGDTWTGTATGTVVLYSNNFIINTISGFRSWSHLTIVSHATQESQGSEYPWSGFRANGWGGFYDDGHEESTVGPGVEIGCDGPTANWLIRKEWLNSDLGYHQGTTTTGANKTGITTGDTPTGNNHSTQYHICNRYGEATGIEIEVGDVSAVGGYGGLGSNIPTNFIVDDGLSGHQNVITAAACPHGYYRTDSAGNPTTNCPPAAGPVGVSGGISYGVSTYGGCTTYMSAGLATSSTCTSGNELLAGTLGVSGATTLTGGGAVPSGATLTIASGGTFTCAVGSTCPSGGPGTGTQFDVPYWATTSTLGSVGGSTTVTGQLLTFQTGAAPIAASPSMQDSSSSPVTSSGYTLQCDSSTTIIDRAHTVRFQSGASAPVVPLSSASGCTGLVTTVMDDGAGSLVFGRTSPDTFSVYNGLTNSTGQTSFTLTNGQFATLNQAASGIWEVRISQLSNLGTPTTLTLTNATGLPISTGVSGLGTGVATGLGNAATGSGSPVLATSPTLVTPNLGTPSAVTLTNGTGLPLAGLATESANTVVANVTGSTAVPTAATIPAGIQNYVLGTGYNQATAHQMAAPLACNDASGSGTTQSCSTTPSFTPASGDCINYTPGTTITGALTLNVNGTSAAAVQKWLGTALVSGDLKANKTVYACFDGTNWQTMTIGNAPGGSAASAGMMIVPGYGGGTPTTLTVNVVNVSGWYVPSQFTSTQVAWTQGGADTTHTMDIGLYTGTSGGTCTLLANLGGITSSGNNAQHHAWTQGTVTVPQGRIYLAATEATAGTVTLGNVSSVFTFLTEGTTGTTTAGVLPSTFTCPADAWAGTSSGLTGTVLGFGVY